MLPASAASTAQLDPASASPPVSPAASTRTTSTEDVTSPVVFEDLESEIDEEYWRKYPDLKPGSMARALTEAEVDSLHRELTETVAGFKDEDLPSWNIHGVLRSPSSF